MKLWFRTPGFEECSWTYVWRELFQAFKKLGHEVPSDPFVTPSDVEDYIELWWGDPRDWDWSGLPVKIKAGVALTEARSILTEGRQKVFENIRECSVLFCPTRSALTGFEEAPIDDVDFHIVPLGVNDSRYVYINRKWDKTLKFLLVGHSQFRKGSWLAPEAFITAFNLEDDVQLTIACLSGDKSPMFNELRAEYGRYPQINFDPKLKKTLISLYQEHHILLSPHLSEGFGLCIPEAMATGMPCIVSRCSAPREFFSKDYGWWIEMSEYYAPVRNCLPDTAGFWRIPDINSLAEMMRYANDNREECEKKGMAASKFVLNNLTWKMTARRMVEILETKLAVSPNGRESK
ncbi:MAG: glycosyltransferase family 4 protein [Deltaproteobacteria bacterium]|nr:glycosyltransferase family 4 protein [Deltaproteobacteria bacterium]